MMSDWSTIVYTNYLWSEQVDINPRDPFSRHPEIDTYSLDSEEELAEAMGERVDSDDQQNFDQDDDSSCFEDGFIVPDNYFSDSELDELLLEDGASPSKVKHQILLAGRKMEERRQMALNQKDF